LPADIAELPPVEVRGQVTDESGNPLSDASVTIKGTSKGVTTDATGVFVIAVPSSTATLVISYTGYATQEIQVNSRTTINISLAKAAGSMNEVVVTALGIARDKKVLSYAVTEVKGDQLAKAGEASFGASLTGKVAGVNATSTASGLAGSTSIIIRGNGSLSGSNQPLYVVNGVPIDNTSRGSTGRTGGRDEGDGLMSLNPDDIESISVLKGGPAAALYGSRAANGVILITTKSGKTQKGLGVEYNTAFSLESPLTFPDWQYEYGSGSRGLKPVSQSDAVQNGRTSWGARLDGSPVVQFDGVERPYVAQRDNVKNFYNNGTTFSNTLALNGGDEKVNFRFSASDLNHHSIVPNFAVKRNTFNLSVNANLSKKILFEGKAQYSFERNTNVPNIGAPWNNPNSGVTEAATSLDIRSLSPGYDENGFEVPWNDWIFSTNPYFAVNKVKNQDERKRLIGSFSVRYNITDFLYARARAGIDYYNREGFDINPTGNLRNLRGEYNSDHSNQYERNVEGLVGFDKTFGDLSVTAMAGGNKMYTRTKGIGLASGFLNVPFAYFIGNGLTQTFTQNFGESAINSLFGSADIGYKNYLYLSVTGRQDWFSTLSKESNTLFYPSVGLSFLFTQVMGSKPYWLNYGKVRVSRAQVGGGAPNPYGLDLQYAASPVPHQGQAVMSISGATIPNTLKPYSSTTNEAGIELRVLNNRLGVDLTVYEKSTTDDIVSASVPQSSGYESVRLNVGKIRNRGIELLLTARPAQTLDFSWDISYNMSYNRNTVVKIADGLSSLQGEKADTQPGYVYNFEGSPFGMIAGFKARRDEKGNIVYNSATGLPLAGPLEALGRGVPPFMLGLTNSFRFKNLTLDLLVDGKFGSVIYSATNAYGTFFGLTKQTVENGVRESGIDVSGVDQSGAAFNKNISAQDYYQGISVALTDPFVYDASFVKMRQVALGYTFSPKLISKTPFKSATVSFIARNLLLLYSEVPNVDPESSYNVGESSYGLESMGIPPTRSYGLKLNVSL
jgi:TonB-linked SusC/RagA family outer membrane protein